MHRFHRFPAAELPTLPYETLLPNDRATLFQMFGEISQLRSQFRSVWDSIPYNYELDRTSIHRLGLLFSVLEEGLVRANVLFRPLVPLHGVYLGGIIPHLPAYDQPSIWLSGDMDLAVIRTFHLGTNHANIIETPLSVVRDSLLTIVQAITNQRTEIMRSALSMSTFVMRTHTRTEVIGASPKSLVVSASTADKLLVRCIHQITHLRLRLDYDTWTEGGPCWRMQFNPAWGDTARAWEDQRLQVQWWGPRPNQQLHHEGTLSTTFNTFVWNVMGAHNPAFEDSLRFIQARAEPKVFVFSNTLTPYSMVNRVSRILGFDGQMEDQRNGGTWIIWDTNALHGHNIANGAGIADMVFVSRSHNLNVQ